MAYMVKRPSQMSSAQFRTFRVELIGSFVAIPIDGELGFGRVIRKANLACYDIKAATVLSLEEIARAPVLFVVGVHYDAFTSGRWRNIGKKPLEPEFERPVKFFRQDVVTGDVDIYQEGKFFAHTDEDLTQMECLASWDLHHVESRLRNHFAGLPDPNTESLRYKTPGAFRGLGC